MAAAQVDVPRLAAYVSLPEDHLSNLISTPSPELVQALFIQLAQKATQHEKLEAEKLRVDVELENAVRSAEQKARLMRANLEKAQKQATELRQQLESEQSSRQALATELDTIKVSTSTSGAELATLQQRITSLEGSNRDTLGLLEAKSRAHDGLAQELSAKHQKTVELRKEVSDLEDKLRAASTAATSAKFREQALEQEVESLKRSNDYLDTELKTKTTEHSKFRKDKSARIAELQRQHEDDTTTIESLQRADKALRTRTAELEQKAEDYLTQIGQLKEDLTRQEENFRSELDTANRLQELMKEQAETEKNRRADLQEQFENVQDEAREEFAKIEEEMHTLQQDKDAAEQRIAELEAQVERLEADIATVAAAPPVGTPRFNGSVRPGSRGSAPRTPARGMSPSAPGSAMRGSMNYTQLVTEFHEVRKERDNLKRHKEELTEQLDSMMQEFEQRRPVLDQMQHEHERLQADVGEMSALVESISNDRDAAKKEARTYQGQVKGLMREGDILRQQLRDLSSQIKVLLLEVNARDQGQDSLSADERVRLEQLARTGDEQEYSNDTDQFISQHLVAFKNIVELQAQNEKLLRVTRELGEKMEGEEAQARQTQAAQDHEEVQELRTKYERVRDELKAMMTQSQAYIRERDIFRRMLSHRGQLPPQSDLESAFGQSVNGAVPSTPARNGVHASVEMSPNSKDAADFSKLIKEMQNNFDSYKQEASSERLQLKDQVSSLTTKNGELRNELARKNGEVLLATERYDMLHGNYTMLKTENGELQKRTQSASDRATQQDLRVQAVAEELVETRTSVESLRNESANLKAEKDFWKTIEKRLTDDNQSLIAERDRLNTLNTNLQNLLNEREHSDHESRRRLQSQVETLESEIQTTKRKLSETEEESKRNSLRREFDSQQAQTRIDDLVKTVSTTREELSGVKATRDQLQLRVDELTIELRSAEERLQVLSARPSGDGTTNLDNTTALGEDQELALQISELKRDLELARKELANTQEQVEQYKQISQSSEEELQSLNDSHDQYRQEMDQLIEDKENKIKELEQTIETMRREADETTTELETLRTDKDNHDRALREQHAQMETEINRFKDAAERAEAAAKFHQEDLKAQAEIATQAQVNYDNELQRHAEASKTLQSVRTELNEAKLELVELRSARDAAQNGLSQAEENWNEAKTKYEHELSEIRSRRDDVNRQNKLLHEQLEKVNNQITELQRARAAGGSPADAGTSANSDDGNLQELIRYLRREKEIVDVQYEMANQESRRLRQQLDHTQSQLEDARLKLSQQLRSEEERERSTLNHNKLLETINELNLIRESNATLRLEKGQAQASLAERVKEVEDLQSQLQPLHAKVQELEDIRESQEQEIRITREARERFEQRYHDLLNKTDSVDPAELEALKEKSTALEAERDELKEQTVSLQSQIDAVPAQIEEAKQELREQNQVSRGKLVEQAKAKNSLQTAKIRELEASVSAATQEKENLQAQLNTVRTELDTANQDKADLSAKLSRAQASAVPNQDASADAEQVASLQERLSQAESRAAASANDVAELRQQLSTSQSRVSSLEQELANIKANPTVAPLPQQQNQQSSTSEADAVLVAFDMQQMEKLREELLAVQKEAEALRTTAAINEKATTVQEGEGQPSIADQIAQNVEAIRAELETRHAERVAAAETRANERAQSMREQFKTKIGEYRTSIAERVKVEHDQEIKKIREEHRVELEHLQARHQSELEELKRQLRESTPMKLNGTASTDSPATPLLSLPDDAEVVKKLLQTSEVAKRILHGNIQKKVNEAKEVAAKEFETKLAEAAASATAAQEAAVKQAQTNAAEMESKRQAIKLNMAQNQLKQAKTKVDYVATAATETPDKAVSEVWSIAKDLKPAPAPAAATGGLAKSTFAPSATSTPVKTAAPDQLSIQQTTPLANPFAQSTGTAAAVPSPQAPAAAPAFNPFAKAEPQEQKDAVPASDNSAAQPAEIKPEAQPTGTSLSRPPSRPPSRQGSIPIRRPSVSQSRLPDAPLGSGAGRGNARGGAQSSLPVAGGRGQQNQRGGIPRGNHGGQRGGRGRGSTIPQPGAQSGLNPSAGQFVPKKRGLDASEHAGPNKRNDRGGKH